MARVIGSTNCGSASAITAALPGSRLLPRSFIAPVLMPVSRSRPQAPPISPPASTETIKVGGKIRPITPATTAPRLAPLPAVTSRVSLMCSFPSASFVTIAASASVMLEARCILSSVSRIVLAPSSST